MSDIKLFRLNADPPEELEGRSVALEKSLQSLIERHLDTFLGVRFLSSEHITGKKHGGRIDTLGIDENGFPVIIEYKRSTNENVINQGLFYLDWLMDHRGEFELLVLKRLGREVADDIDWTGPRLICIAGDFTKYDGHAVEQMNRNIELMRYKRFGDDLLMFELVNVVTGGDEEPGSTEGSSGIGAGGKYATVSDLLAKASDELKDLYDSLTVFMTELGDDVQTKTLKNYFAFRRIRNFACVEVHPAAGKLTVFVKMDPDSMALEEGFTRDVRTIGHFGTGDLEITMSTRDDLERAKPLIEASYEAS